MRKALVASMVAVLALLAVSSAAVAQSCEEPRPTVRFAITKMAGLVLPQVDEETVIIPLLYSPADYTIVLVIWYSERPSCP